jgi:single-stranded-DNA-specific exonuclease
MNWNLIDKTKIAKNAKEIVEIVLANRGFSSSSEIAEFLHPKNPEEISPQDIGVSKKELEKTFKRIKKAVSEAEPIVIYGDYDADGICSTAIWWETLIGLDAKVMPFIPHREKEGYGLSIDGLKSILADEKYQISKKGLIICVDSGVVANEAVDFANKNGLDVIIVDHHELPKILPAAYSIVHTTKLCAAGLSFVVTGYLSKKEEHSRLELAAIATVTDLMPLTYENRSIVKFGLQKLNQTERPGLLALFSVAGIKNIGTYEIGYQIGPRLNASGRIESALTALRLLCTNSHEKAREFAQGLNDVNRDRQMMTEEMTLHAVENSGAKLKPDDRIIVIESDTYHQGIIGLIAGKLVERYYLPTIVIAKGELISKASARSITGFNIIEAIRKHDDILINAGGHPMAAGFSINTKNISLFKEKITLLAAKEITKVMLEKELRVDCEISPKLINSNLINHLIACEPFGFGNPQPVFSSEFVIRSLRMVGAEGKHLKMTVVGGDREIEAIGFGKGIMIKNLFVGQSVKLAFSVDENTFNNFTSLQLRVKDIQFDTEEKPA